MNMHFKDMAINFLRKDRPKMFLRQFLIPEESWNRLLNINNLNTLIEISTR
ncbi:MAG: hypothetical protein MPEBLZ_03550 [Candidatus Methanoperedens nitroreducens]|uniref:Uncharacterized protein n=1 Tax=Candidatus Methanoperedens nitratireducens TaxID=1392998 RepID=A0A0P7ZEG0_9EURY|nr:MAG: hypothetical protein MPEBLZ_03550 [Candidatus Methanoperedens sp. BLZ1]